MIIDVCMVCYCRFCVSRGDPRQVFVGEGRTVCVRRVVVYDKTPIVRPSTSVD